MTDDSIDKRILIGVGAAMKHDGIDSIELTSREHDFDLVMRWSGNTVTCRLQRHQLDNYHGLAFDGIVFHIANELRRMKREVEAKYETS